MTARRFSVTWALQERAIKTRIAADSCKTFQLYARGIRKECGGTLPLGRKRDTLVYHPPYQLCVVACYDRERKILRLKHHRTNEQFTPYARPTNLTYLPFRHWLLKQQP
jgi:hypothetical protein